MAHIFFLILPTAGHLQPTLGVAEELVARGHRVTYALPDDLASMARAIGADVLMSPFDRARFLASMVPRKETDSYEDADEYMAVLRWLTDKTAETLPLLEPLFVDDRPDVVVNDPSSYWSGLFLAQREGVPVIRSTPTYAANEHWSLHPPVDSDAPPEDPAMLALFGEITDLLSRHGGGDLGELTAAVHGGPGLFYMPRYFQYAGDTFDADHHFVGPCATRQTVHGDWTPPEHDGRLVLASLGTVYNQDLDFYRACIEAFADSSWHLLLALGGGLDVDALGPLPDHVHAYDFLPYSEVLPHVDLLVSHAGMSTCMEALSHGIPVIAVPGMPEPRATARRMAELDLGAVVLPSDVTAGGLRALAEELTHDPRITAGLDRMRRELTEAGGVRAAADAVEALVGERP